MKFVRRNSLFLILVTVSLILGFSGPVALAESYEAKLGPTLQRLMDLNDEELKKAGERLNLAPYAPQIAIYSDSRPLEVKKSAAEKEDAPLGTKEYKYDVPEGAEADKVGIILKTDSPVLLKSKGVDVGSVVGDIVTAKVTLEQLEKVARSRSVRYVRASRRVETKLNVSVPAVGGNRLHENVPRLGGSGVLVGDVDTGIDYDHKDFRVEKVPDDGIDEETSRIQYLWDQVQDAGDAPVGPPPSFGYGDEYTKEEIESDIANGYGPFQGIVWEYDLGGHGSHVMGIAGGDGSSTDPAKYVGMAPQTQLAMVKTTLYDADIINGVNYIFQKADKLGIPAVVNLSLGGHYGPHDGTDLFSQAMDELAGPSRIIAVSAGNEGDQFIHGSDTVEEGESSQLVFKVGEPAGGGKSTGGFGINVWYSGDSQFDATLVTPNGHTVNAPSGTKGSLPTPDGSVYINNASGGPNPENGDKELEVEIFGSDYESSTDVTPGDWGLIISAPGGTDGGRYDAWYYVSATSRLIYPPVGNNQMSVGIPGTADDVITVGAWLTKAEWTGADGDKHGYSQFTPEAQGNIAAFSSLGPTRDGRRKPDITAPGMGVASALSGTLRTNWDMVYPPSYYDILVTPDQKHYISQGTSMSAPMVSGLIALMLQEDPSLTPAEIKTKLTDTATTDNFTSVGYDPLQGTYTRDAGTAPNYTWGFGKLNGPKAGRTLGIFLPKEGENPVVKIGPNPAPDNSDNVNVYYGLPAGANDPHLYVYNVSGKTVFDKVLDKSDNVFSWDLTTNSGENLGNGLYVYILKANGSRSDLGRLLVERR